MMAKIPKFNDAIEAYIVQKIAQGKPLRELASAIYERYPEKFDDIEDLDKDGILEVIYDRLRRRKYDDKYRSYWRIKEEQEEIELEIALIDIADPIEQLRMCDLLYRQVLGADTDEETDQLKKKVPLLIRLMAHANKTVEMLISPNDEPFEANPDELPDTK